MKDLDFLNNRATNGGAVYCDSCIIGSIENCKFEDNYVTKKGKSIYHIRGPLCQLKDSKFDGKDVPDKVDTYRG